MKIPQFSRFTKMIKRLQDKHANEEFNLKFEK